VPKSYQLVIYTSPRAYQELALIGQKVGSKMCTKARYHLGMSVTTKSHLIEDHSLEQQEELHGIDDLGEDFGERNHQYQTKADRRLGCVRNFATRESIKSKEEVEVKSEVVKAKIMEIQGKQKRGPYEGTVE
jgi:hypothetical protein